MRFPRYLKESPFCDGCTNETKCPLQLQKDNLLDGLTINSCSEWKSKAPQKPRPCSFQKYNYKYHSQQIHFGENGLAECGMTQNRMGIDFKISNNPDETTCLNCKRSHEWQRTKYLTTTKRRDI